MRRALIGLLAVGVLGSAPALSARGAPPSSLSGLAVKQEDIGKPGPRSARDYLVDVRLYSLRAKKQLEGTLQIGRFRDSAPTTLGFRRQIAGQVGTSVPREQRIASTTVFVTRGKRLGIAVWFRGRDMFVLSIREGYTKPKSLIRAALEVQP
jgi:hypothetical protein